MASTARRRVTLAELLAVLSLAADLGMGQPMEHVLRQTLIALRLAARLELDEAEREVVYYSALVAWVGCHVDAYEQAKWFGDDTALKTDFRHTDFATAASKPIFMLRHLGAGRPIAERTRLGLTFLGDGRKAAEAMLDNHWTAADELAARLGLAQRVRDSVEQTFERWDGKGVPKGLKGEEILVASRLVTLADVVEVFHRAGGTAAAVEVARQRRATQFDPRLVDLFTAHAPALCAGLDDASTWSSVLAAEPALGVRLGDEEFESALEAIADFTDVKSPYTIGHSRGVADLARDAARAYGLSEPAARQVRLAGLVHDLGRLGVPNTIWDKAGPLSHSETERIRLHPYLTERMLACSPALAPLAAIAVQHHERMDGSGYPRGLLPDRTSPAPPGLPRRRGRRPGPGRGHGRPARCRGGNRRAGRCRAPHQHPQAGRASQPDAARGRGAPPAGPRAVQPGDRRALGYLTKNSQPSRRAHLCQDRNREPRAGQPVRGQPRPDRRARTLIGQFAVSRAQDPHPGDPPVLAVVVRLLLDQVVTVGLTHPQQVTDMLATGKKTLAERFQPQDLVARIEPSAQDELVDDLARRGGLPVTARGQGLEVDRVGQQRAQRGTVLGGQRSREALPCGAGRLAVSHVVSS